MARAKNTTRAAARRQARVESRAELDARDQDELEHDEDAAAATEAPAQRRSLISLPNFRQDIRDLPQILTSRNSMILAPLMLLIGFVLEVAVTVGAMPTEFGLPMPLAAAGWISFADAAVFYVEMFFLPPTLLIFFLAGYIAPRASWLVGLLTGLLVIVLWAIIIFGLGRTHLTAGVPIPDDLKAPLVGQMALLSLLWGPFGAAFAAWYRDFLRRMRDQGMARRMQREQVERAKRREQRQSDRRSLKSR